MIMSLTADDKQWFRDLLREQLREQSEGLVTLISNLQDSLQKQIGGLENKIGDFRLEMLKRLDRVESTMLHVDGGLTALAHADIQRDQQITEILTRQHAHQRAIDELYERVKKLEG